MPRKFLRTVVPGYRYGSELPLVELINSAPYFGESKLPVDVPLVQRLGLLIEFQPFDANRRCRFFVNPGAARLLGGSDRVGCKSHASILTLNPAFVGAEF